MVGQIIRKECLAVSGLFKVFERRTSVPLIMHLLFTDSILFYDKTEVNFHAVRNILETYERGSRPMINKDKSIFTFSSKMGDEKVAELSDCLGIGFTKELETYLELLTWRGGGNVRLLVSSRPNPETTPRVAREAFLRGW